MTFFIATNGEIDVRGSAWNDGSVLTVTGRFPAGLFPLGIFPTDLFHFSPTFCIKQRILKGGIWKSDN